jgi:predicted Rossmann fold nucleotide-binding protein DprA/Smf involved in DNA uptake
MTMVSINTKAILLLTSPLIIGRNRSLVELLTPGEYNKLARALIDQSSEPGDLLGSAADELIVGLQNVVQSNRLVGLLGRGFLLSQAIEHWESRSIWVYSRADAEYPQRLIERLKDVAPPIIFGCGDNILLGRGGLAVVGSRNVDEKLIKYTENIGSLAARAQVTVISGGAKGIDRAAMFGSLQAGGRSIGIVADSLERLALAADSREYIMDNKLVLISFYDPAAGFDVGNAMQRNKSIYALADAALVVNSDYKKGGTWAGAIEQLEKLHLVPVYIRADADSGAGLQTLAQKGARTWPNPETSEELDEIFIAQSKLPCSKLPQIEQQLSFLEQPEKVAETHNPNYKYKT